MQRLQDIVQIFQQKICVFTIAQDAQIAQHRENQKTLCCAGTAAGFGTGDQKAGAVGNQGDRAKKEQIAAVRTGIEKAAGGQKPQVTDPARQQEINKIYDWEK